MFITERKEHNIKIVRLNGRMSHKILLSEKDISDIVSGEPEVLVDCSPLSQISPTGLSQLVSTMSKANQKQGTFYLCSVPENVKAGLVFDNPDKVRFCNSREEVFNKQSH